MPNFISCMLIFPSYIITNNLIIDSHDIVVTAPYKCSHKLTITLGITEHFVTLLSNMRKQICLSQAKKYYGLISVQNYVFHLMLWFPSLNITAVCQRTGI